MKEIEKTIQIEGGYVNNPNDSGGETKYGISKRWHPDIDIKNLTIEQAVEIYKIEYWDKLNLDRFAFPPFRWKLFDIAVNMGCATTQTFLGKVESKDTVRGVYELIELQMKRYVMIIIGKPKQLVFLRGWTNRAFENGLDLLDIF